MIRTQQEGAATYNLVFKEHALAHRYLDGLKGLECGAAAHNPFGLDSLNVAPGDDNHIYRAAEIGMCGEYALIDIEAEAHALPVDDSSQDYVISSHVFEHLPNPVAAISEWVRVVRDGGYIFMIVPLPGALTEDVGRPLATEAEWALASSSGVTVDTWDYEAKPVPGGRRGHYYVYDAETLLGLISTQFNLAVVDVEAVDSKVGNGFTLVFQVSKPPAPEAEPIPEIAALDELVASFPTEAPAPVIAEPVVADVEPTIQKAKKAKK